MAAHGDHLLLRVARYGGGWTWLLAVMAIVGIGAELLLPTALGRALDAVVGDGGTAGWLLAAVGLVVVVASAETLSDLAEGYGTARATAHLRRILSRHTLALDPRAASRFTDGDLVSRLAAQVTDAGGAGAAVVALATTALPSLGSVVALALIDPWLGLTFVVGLVLLAGLLRAFVTDTSDAVTGYQRAQGALATRLVETLAGARPWRPPVRPRRKSPGCSPHCRSCATTGREPGSRSLVPPGVGRWSVLCCNWRLWEWAGPGWRGSAHSWRTVRGDPVRGARRRVGRGGVGADPGCSGPCELPAGGRGVGRADPSVRHRPAADLPYRSTVV